MNTRANIIGGALTLLLLAGCGTNVLHDSASKQPRVASHERDVSAHAAGSVSVRIELSSRTIKAGTSIDGTFVIDNETGAPFRLADPPPGQYACSPQWEVLLDNARVRANPAFPLVCAANPREVAPGVTRLPFKLSATFSACLESGPHAGLPRCVNGGPAPLPAGVYQARMFGDLGLLRQTPQVVPVHVVA